MRLTMLLTGALLLLSSVAQAEGDVLPNIYAGVVGGASVSTSDTAPAPDPYGPALGLRAGLTIPLTEIYVGGLGLYHFGEDIGGVGTSALMLGVEGGYEYSLGPIVLRPNLGVGYVSQTYTTETSTGTEFRTSDEAALYLSPGLNLFLALGLMIGAEIRYNAVFNDYVPDSVSVLGTIGLGI